MIDNPRFVKFDPSKGFNQKIVFKMLFHAGPKNELEGVYGKYMVYLGKADPETEEEKALSQRKAAYDYLLREGVSPETIAECGARLGAGRLPAAAVELTDDPLRSAASTMRGILLSQGLPQKNWPLSIVACNAILQKAGYVPIIIRRGVFNHLRNAILFHCPDDVVIRVFRDLSALNANYCEEYARMAPDDVVSAVTGCAAELRQRFGVQAISLIGSFANGLYNEYSDVDFLVRFGEGRERMKPALKAFLSERIGRRVDVIVFGDTVSESLDLQRFKRTIFM